MVYIFTTTSAVTGLVRSATAGRGGTWSFKACRGGAPDQHAARNRGEMRFRGGSIHAFGT